MPKLPELVQRLQYTVEQKNDLIGWLEQNLTNDELHKKRDGNYEYLDTMTPEHLQTVLIPKLGPQSAVRRDLLFVGFSQQDQAKVDLIAAAFGLVSNMVQDALSHTGTYDTVGLSAYE